MNFYIQITEKNQSSLKHATFVPSIIKKKYINEKTRALFPKFGHLF